MPRYPAFFLPGRLSILSSLINNNWPSLPTYCHLSRGYFDPSKISAKNLSSLHTSLERERERGWGEVHARCIPWIWTPLASPTVLPSPHFPSPACSLFLPWSCSTPRLWPVFFLGWFWDFKSDLQNRFKFSTDFFYPHELINSRQSFFPPLHVSFGTQFFSIFTSPSMISPVPHFQASAFGDFFLLFHSNFFVFLNHIFPAVGTTRFALGEAQGAGRGAM